MKKKIIRTSAAPIPAGPYSQATVCGNLVFTAGQIAMDPANGQLIEADVAAQTRQTLLNVRSVLEAAGSDLNHILKTNVYLADMNDFQIMNDVYAEFFRDSPPARTTVQVARLPMGALVEVETLASVILDQEL